MINFLTWVNKAWQSSMQKQALEVEGFQNVTWYLALVGISVTIDEYVSLWIFFILILAKENSPSTLKRKDWIFMPKLYLISQQLRQYVFPICFFFPQALRIWKEQNLCSPYLKSYIQIYFQILNLSVGFGSFSIE